MFGYKAVRDWRTQYISATDSGIVVNYRIGERTERIEGLGPFALFENVYWAEFFLSRYVPFPQWYPILYCEYQPSDEDRLWYDEKKTSRNGYSKLRGLPTGTVLADWVLPIRVLPSNERVPLERLVY